MKTRTCPHCGYKYSITEYRKQVLFKMIFSEWNCKNCSNKLTFDFGRRVIVALAFGSFYIALFSLKFAVGMTPFRWAVLITIYVIGSFFIFTFDTFKKVK